MNYVARVDGGTRFISHCNTLQQTLSIYFTSSVGEKGDWNKRSMNTKCGWGSRRRLWETRRPWAAGPHLCYLETGGRQAFLRASQRKQWDKAGWRR